MVVKVITGDCREVLRSLPSESVSCIVTSPPYFGLRDYGADGQIGLEATPDEYVAELVAVFREVRRVLRSDGTFWLNLGDSYAANRGYQVPSTKGGAKHGPAQGVKGRGSVVPEGLKPKDRMMIPARVALALQADGWWLRDEIIWHKPNPMPVSVTDRTTPAHEMVYMFSKPARYHYDMDAVKETADEKSASRYKYAFSGVPEGAVVCPGDDQGQRTRPKGMKEFDGKRQPRSVWTVTPKPFKGAHFATFPPALIETCIKAGAPAGTVVLDPFGGAGTTGLVADRLGRDAILIEINEAYAAMARDRIRSDSPLFVAAE